MIKTPDQTMLKQIYPSMLKRLSQITEVKTDLNYYRKVNYKNWTDNDFFETMSEVIFYSNLPKETVNHKLTAIKKAFSNFDVGKVAGYTKQDIQKLAKNPGIIRHKARIEGVVKNAKEFKKIIKDNGSFLNYLDAFIERNDLDGLTEDLVDRFEYIGWLNVYDFLKELCLPFIKPDINIRRIFYRLGLTTSEKETDEVVYACLKIGEEIGKAMKETLCIVDCVLWSYGHYICTKRKPQCDHCNLMSLCQFYIGKYKG